MPFSRFAASSCSFAETEAYAAVAAATAVIVICFINFSSIVPPLKLGMVVFDLINSSGDFSNLTASLNETTGVNKNNFLYVSVYISFINSLLEEFFFRGFAFITLKKTVSKSFAYIFSSTLFALYHIAMMIGWFGVPVILISLVGLFAGGLIFDRFDDIKDNIILSWLIHMFANFSINTIGFILFRL